MIIARQFLLLSLPLNALITLKTQAQDSTLTRPLPRVLVKFAPLALIDPDATLQAGLEVKVGSRSSVQGEYGDGWPTLTHSNSDHAHTENQRSIHRIRAEWRVYSGRYRTNRRKNAAIKTPFPLGNYLAVEGFYKSVSWTEVDGTIRSQPNEPVKFQSVKVHVPFHRQGYGTHLKVGRQFALSGNRVSTRGQVLIDIYFGAGVRWVNWQYDQNLLKPGEELTHQMHHRSLNNLGTNLIPTLSFGLKLGFAL